MHVSVLLSNTWAREDDHDLDHVLVIFIRLWGRRRHGDSSEIIEKKHKIVPVGCECARVCAVVKHLVAKICM